MYNKNKTDTMNKEFLKMQKIAGLITESQINEEQYAEPMVMIQNIVDNWSDGGIDAEPAMIRIDKILQDNFEDEDGEGFIDEGAMIGKHLDQDDYMEALNLFFDALGNGARSYDETTWTEEENTLVNSIANVLNRAGVDIS